MLRLLHLEGTMRKKLQVLTLLAVPLLLVAGCTTLGASDRALLDEVKATADEANRNAQAAAEAARRAEQSAAASAQAAQQAAADAQAASEKADRIFMQLQRK